MNSNIWVIPHPIGWALKRRNAQTSQRIFPTQRSAVDYAKAVARREGVELVIEERDGRVHLFGTETCLPPSPRDNLPA